MIPTSLAPRAQDVLRQIVENFLASGEPMPSRSIAEKLQGQWSPATVRNIMADLEQQGLIYAPHVSAGRLPTDAGLKLFVEGMLQLGQLHEHDAERLNVAAQLAGRNLPDLLATASEALSGLARCTSFVVVPKADKALQHIEFVPLSDQRALVVLVTIDGMVENRVIDLPPHSLPGSLAVASNFLSYRLRGQGLQELRQQVELEIAAERAELDSLSALVVQRGLGVFAPESDGQLIIKGQAHLLEHITELEQIDRIRHLLQQLEAKDSWLKLLQATASGEGIKIFIGADNQFFDLAGGATILRPYLNSRDEIIGAVGVIGPARLNYARILPMVDYTADLITRLLSKDTP